MTPALRTRTTREVSRLCGVSVRQLQWWADEDIVRPSLEKHQRSYTDAEVAWVSLAADLRTRRIPLKAVRTIRNHVQRIREQLAQRAAMATEPRLYLLIDERLRRLQFFDDRPKLLRAAARWNCGVVLIDLYEHFERAGLVTTTEKRRT